MIDSNEHIQSQLHKVLSINHLSESVFIIRIERKGLKFTAGQHIGVGLANSIYTREYSIYSGEVDDYLEILVKEVLNGFISPKLKNTKPGEYLQVEEPRGYFSLPEQISSGDKYLFVATGTGISPFHSMIKSNPEINYEILHGIRRFKDACESQFYNPKRIIFCTSKEISNNTFNGRVTQYLETFSLEDITQVFLCGNVNMINEIYDLMIKRQFDVEKIHTEVYF